MLYSIYQKFYDTKQLLKYHQKFWRLAQKIQQKICQNKMIKVKGEMRIAKRKLEELNVSDDFLFQELVTREEKGERFCQILLSTILEKEIENVKVVPKKSVLGFNTGRHGIKIDAYIEADSSDTVSGKSIEDIKVQTDIYDIEPNEYQTEYEAKRTRCYHALIDSKILKSGLDYGKLKNVIIVMILPYDPFGRNRMMYTFETHCKEDPAIEYSDGIKTIYLYTKGTEGIPSKELRDMLKYIENSTLENANNKSLQEIHKFVNEIRHDEEVGVSYMKSWEMEKMLKEEGIRQGTELGIKALIETCMELGVSKEDTLIKIGQKFPLAIEESKGYLNKYWQS